MQCKLWDRTSVLTDSITQWCRPLNHQFVHLFLALYHLSLSHLLSEIPLSPPSPHFSFHLIRLSSPSIILSLCISIIESKARNQMEYYTAVHLTNEKGSCVETMAALSLWRSSVFLVFLPCFLQAVKTSFHSVTNPVMSSCCTKQHAYNSLNCIERKYLYLWLYVLDAVWVWCEIRSCLFVYCQLSTDFQVNSHTLERHAQPTPLFPLTGLCMRWVLAVSK